MGIHLENEFIFGDKKKIYNKIQKLELLLKEIMNNNKNEIFFFV